MTIGDITLSFDNGPTVEVTPLVLDVLARQQIKASFFVLGKNLQTPQTQALMHRAAGEHDLRLQGLAVAGDAHLLQYFAQRVFGGPVDHHPHRAVTIVLANERDAAREMRVVQRGQRHQQLVGQR